VDEGERKSERGEEKKIGRWGRVSEKGNIKFHQRKKKKKTAKGTGVGKRVQGDGG